MKYILFQLRLKNLIKQNLIKTENRLKNIKKFQKILLNFPKIRYQNPGRNPGKFHDFDRDRDPGK